MKPLLILLLLFMLPHVHAQGQTLSLYGTAKADITANVYNKDSFLYENGSGDYLLDNYLLFNTQAVLPKDSPVFAVLNTDILVREMISAASDRPVQEITLTLNEAYLNIPLTDFLFFTIGKRRVVWGTGISYNPSDFINPPKDPLHPGEERRGVYGGMLELFTEWFSLTQVAVFYDKLDYLGYGAKLSTSALVPSTDINLVFYYEANSGCNMGASLDTTPFGELPVLQNLALHAEAGLRQKSERPIYDDGTGALVQRPERDDFFKNFLAGLRYTVPGWETFIAVEYYYIDDGYLPAELDEIIRQGLAADIPYDPGLMGRHTLMFTVSQPQLTQRANPFTDTLGISAAVLLNLLDGSFLVSATMESTIINGCVFSLEGGCFTGEKGTEYGLSPIGFYVSFAAVLGF
jgi:hypothetical protein